MGKEAARILARSIIEAMPESVQLSFQEWDILRDRIAAILTENKGLIIASISEEDWLEYGSTH
jgi:hypothetical protein